MEMDKKVETKPQSYFTDPDWYERNNRSFSALTQTRLCPSCQKKQGTKRFDPLVAIEKCCSKKEGFLPPNLPLKESLFRIFLARGNRPLELEEIYNALKEWLTSAEDPRTVSLEAVQRILENDRFYGFSTLPGEEGV